MYSIILRIACAIVGGIIGGTIVAVVWVLLDMATPKILFFIFKRKYVKYLESKLYYKMMQLAEMRARLDSKEENNES